MAGGLLLLGKAFLHIGVGLRGNSALALGSTGSRLLPLVDVVVEAFHFFVLVPL